jgi:hypothetical protein
VNERLGLPENKAMKLLTTLFLTLLLIEFAGGSYGQTSEFSVVIEEDRGSALFVFHQSDLLIYSDYADFPYMKMVHEGNGVDTGWILDYSLQGITLEALMREEARKLELTAEDIDYSYKYDSQELRITKRSMVLIARKNIRTKKTFGIAFFDPDVAWHSGTFNLIFDNENMMKLVPENAFTFCKIVEQISSLESSGNKLRGFGDVSLSDLISSKGSACTDSYELVPRDPELMPSPVDRRKLLDDFFLE